MFRMMVFECDGASRAFKKVTTPEYEDLVWRQLFMLTCLKGETILQADSPFPIPVYTLRRFPSRASSFADEISRFQSSDLYGYIGRIDPVVFDSEVLGKKAVPKDLADRIRSNRAQLPKLVELPRLLQLYADCVEAVCKVGPIDASKALIRVRLMWTIALIDLVKKLTKKPHFPEVATLLTATYLVQGSDEIVDAHNLSMQYSRHTRRK